MLDKDEARAQRRDSVHEVKNAFIALASPYEDVALPAAQQLLKIFSDDDKHTSALATIDDERRSILKRSRDHSAPAVSEAVHKTIEWIDFWAIQFGLSSDKAKADPNAGIDFFVENHKIISDIAARIEITRLEALDEFGDPITQITFAAPPDLEEGAMNESEENLFKELLGTRKRSAPEEVELIGKIFDFGFIVDSKKKTDSRLLAAEELEKSVSTASEPELFDIARIINVPALRAASEETGGDEAVKRPIQTLMTAIAVKIAPFFGIETAQAQASPDRVLDALHEIKTSSEAAPGSPAENLTRAMIARRQSFKIG